MTVVIDVEGLLRVAPEYTVSITARVRVMMVDRSRAGVHDPNATSIGYSLHGAHSLHAYGAPATYHVLLRVRGPLHAAPSTPQPKHAMRRAVHAKSHKPASGPSCWLKQAITLTLGLPQAGTGHSMLTMSQLYTSQQSCTTHTTHCSYYTLPVLPIRPVLPRPWTNCKALGQGAVVHLQNHVWGFAEHCHVHNRVRVRVSVEVGIRKF